MRVSKEQAARNRARVLQAAGRLLRERGFERVAVAEMTQAAGLTHGGFYNQFDSKEALAAEACAATLKESEVRWRKRAAESEAPLRDLVASYLSCRHRDNPGSGCTLAALGTEAAHQGKAVRRSFAAGLQGLAGVLAELLPGRAAAKRRKSLAMLSAMAGALMLSRAVEDPALSAEILEATRDELLA